MIKRVVARLHSFGLFEQIYVVADDQKIVDALHGSYCQVMVSEGSFFSGTQRIASVLRKIKGDLIINIQCDEPIIPRSYVESLCELMGNTGVSIGTICHPIEDAVDLFDYNRVKVVFDTNNRAMYFSRQAIPAQREALYDKWLDNSVYYQHIGIYGFRREVLPLIGALEVLPLEKAEMLEQLNWMQHGFDIQIAVVNKEDTLSVDTNEDLEKALRIFRSQNPFNK